MNDGDVHIDNNRIENAIRHFTVGRKNQLFNNTAIGAKCSAFLYSIILTAQANGMDVEKVSDRPVFKSGRYDTSSME